MNYQYAIDVLTEDGRPLEHAVVTPDWKAALDWVHFEGVRAGSLPPLTRTGPGAVEPIWDGRHGAPYVAGLRVIVRADGGAAAVREIPKTYLRGLAHDLSADLVTRGRLEKDGVFRWVVSAVAVPKGEAPGGAGQGAVVPEASEDDLFGVEEVARPLPLEEASLASFLERSVFAGPDDESARHVPVFCPQSIVDEAKELARQSSDLETGGVLAGKLHRDSHARGTGAPELFVEITAQIPAPHTVAESTKLTFTAETWAAVRAAIALRGREELLCGWMHSHLDWCRLRNCPPERRRTCSGAHPFFSREDAHLHATCFPSGYQMALLISDSAATGGLTVSAFGWSQGMVVPRGFHVLRNQQRSVRKEGATHDESIAS